ncbi:MAG: prolipoprotein diacylglyceryl transferase [Nocardioidaceae bacterium]|nr:prolipoprotein diacylglyceryl transferase [Nocardioidaceae bacterium]
MSGSIATRVLGRRHLRVGRLRVPTYTVMLYLGCVSGTLAGAAFAQSTGLAPGSFVPATILLLIPAFIGARLWFVLQHRETFRAEPQRIWRRGEGGSSLYGGLVLGVVFSVPVLALAGLPFRGFWDAAAITMLVGLILTRVGCLLNGCCVGRETAGRLGVHLPDHHGRWRRRYPTPVLEAAWATIVLAGALALSPELSFSGALFAGVVAAYAAGRLVLEPTRESACPEREQRVNLIFSALLLAVAVSALVWRWPA